VCGDKTGAFRNIAKLSGFKSVFVPILCFWSWILDDRKSAVSSTEMVFLRKIHGDIQKFTDKVSIYRHNSNVESYLLMEIALSASMVCSRVHSAPNRIGWDIPAGHHEHPQGGVERAFLSPPWTLGQGTKNL